MRAARVTLDGFGEMAEFRVTAPRDTSAMGSVYGAAPDSSVQWLRQYLPTAAGDFLADREQQALQPASPREVAGDVISTAMNVLPAGPRMTVPRGQGIRAYHGSPYDFDRFDLSKIGTGEGAQSYGHGLYFAENPKVAADYKGKLSPQNEIEGIAQTVAQKYGLNWSNMSRYERSSLVDKVAADPELAATVSNRFPKGRMYEVNINAKPEQFLDWDRPLSEQSTAVRNALFESRNSNIRNAVHSFSEKPSANIYGMISNTGVSPSAASASAALRAAGIPGIRYLDQGSRVGHGIAGSEAEALVREFGSLENALKEAQTRTQGARTSEVKDYWSKRLGELQEYPKPTSNYVLFNDKIIDILRKYGLAGGMAGAGAASQDQSSQ